MHSIYSTHTVHPSLQKRALLPHTNERTVCAPGRCCGVSSRSCKADYICMHSIYSGGDVSQAPCVPQVGAAG